MLPAGRGKGAGHSIITSSMPEAGPGKCAHGIRSSEPNGLRGGENVVSASTAQYRVLVLAQLKQRPRRGHVRARKEEPYIDVTRPLVADPRPGWKVHALTRAWMLASYVLRMCSEQTDVVRVLIRPLHDAYLATHCFREKQKLSSIIRGYRSSDDYEYELYSYPWQTQDPLNYRYEMRGEQTPVQASAAETLSSERLIEPGSISRWANALLWQSSHDIFPSGR